MRENIIACDISNVKPRFISIQFRFEQFSFNKAVKRAWRPENLISPPSTRRENLAWWAKLLCGPHRIRSLFLPSGCSAECGVSRSSINQIGGNGLGTTSWRWLDYFSSQSQHLRAARLGTSRQLRLSGQQKSSSHRHPGELFTLLVEHSVHVSLLGQRGRLWN